jgi:hypothetical protein
MKILCLIIDHVPHVAWRETYDVHRRTWNACLDLNPAVEGYFLHADPALRSEHSVEGRCFTVRCHERYDTIFEKTRKAIEVLLVDHDYVVRTNISSLYDFAVLRRSDLPTEDLYAGYVYPDYGSFVSGSGMILSRDVAKKLLPPPDLTLSPCDDVAISQILRARGIVPRSVPRFDYDYSKGPEQVVVGQHFHYRLRDVDDPQRVKERAATEHVFAEICRAVS